MVKRIFSIGGPPVDAASPGNENGIVAATGPAQAHESGPVTRSPGTALRRGGLSAWSRLESGDPQGWRITFLSL